MRPPVTFPGLGEMRRCFCGKRARRLRCFWKRPRAPWNARCPDGHCGAALLKDATTRHEAIRRWNAHEIHYSAAARREAARRDVVREELRLQLEAEARERDLV